MHNQGFKKIFNGYKFVFKQIKTVGVWTLPVYFLSVIISGSSSVITSYILKSIISILENTFSSKSKLPYTYLFFFILLYAVFNIFENTLHRFNITSNRILGMHLSQNVKREIVKKISNIEHKIFYNPNFQNNYTSVLSSSQSEPIQLIMSTFYSIVSLIQIIEIILILIKFNFIALLILILFLSANMFLQFKIQHKYVDVWDLQSKSMRENSYYFHVMTNSESLKEMQVFWMYDYFSKKMKQTFSNNIRIWKEFGTKEVLQNAFGQMFSCIGVIVSVFYLITDATKYNCSIADFVFYLNLVFNFQNVCKNLIQEISVGYKGILFIDKLLDFLKMDNAIKCGTIAIIKNRNSTLEFKNVSFKYPGNNKNSLENINLKLEKGQKVCLIGKNGCGKSTLVNLILRLYDPTGGKIFLNGIDIKNYSVKEYRKNILPIFQDYQRYAIPIKDYISCGTVDRYRDSDIKNLKMATKLSCALDFINVLPSEFDTMLTKRFDFSGSELSGGQWQKLAISRVFFNKAPILIFDEPTSSLDHFSEKFVFEEIGKIKNKLVIFITHRMSTIKYADKIVFMDRGKVLGVGSHFDLLKNCKNYKKLFDAQN